MQKKKKVFKKCRLWGNMWGRLEVVAMKINEQVFFGFHSRKANTYNNRLVT